MAAGVEIQAICLYPITDYPGWDNGRKCATGLLGEADAEGDRPVCGDYLAEIRQQMAAFEALVPQVVA